MPTTVGKAFRLHCSVNRTGGHMSEHIHPFETAALGGAARINPLETSPQGVAALVAVERYIAASGLDAKLLALLNTRVSQINGCTYCIHMHTADARARGESEARLFLLDAWHESKLYTEQERAALAWAEALTDIKETHAPDEVYQAVRRHFSEKAVADLSIAVAM